MSKPFTEQCFDAKSMLKLTEANVAAITEARLGSNKFVSLGEISLDGIDVFAGFKSRLGGGSGVERWAREAIFADKVISRFPETICSFPAFTIPVIVELDLLGVFGFLTEDFTHNGKRELEEFRKRYPEGYVERKDVESALERKVYDTFNGKVHKDSFKHFTGLVSGLEVMIDYDDVSYPSSAELEEYLAIAKDIVLTVPELA